MADSYERLAVLLEARVADYEKKIASAARSTATAQNRIQKSVNSLNNSVSRSMSGMAGKIAAGFAAMASTRAAVALMDSATSIQNALKVAGLAGDELRSVYESLYVSAQRNSAPVESLVTLYSRLALTQKELGVSQQELLGFTDKIALALRVGGTSATEASGALLQLSQALGGGVVRAEEFNSVLEGAPTIAQAAAAGLKEAGGSVAKLRQLVVDGKVSSEAFFRAFEAGAATLEGKVAGAQSTTAQGFVRLQNVLVDTAGKIDAATGASGKLGAGINELADIVQDFGKVVVSVSESDLGSFLGWMSDGIGKVNELKRVMGGLPGMFDKMSKLQYDAFNGREIGSTLRQDNIQNRINSAFEETAMPKISKGGRLPAAQTVTPVSVDDYKVTATKTGGGRHRADDYAREIEQIRERTAAINAAYAAQAAINPLVDDYGYSVEKARAKQELMNAAQSAGKTVTPALAAEIDSAAEAYARAGSAAEKLAEKQSFIRREAEEAMSFNKDLARGIVDGFASGAKAADVFADSLKRIGSRLLDLAFDGLFKSPAAGGGLLGGLGSLLGFANGGYTGVGGKYQPAGIVHRGEYVFDQQSVRAAGGPSALDAMRRGLKGYSDGGAVGLASVASMPNLPSVTQMKSSSQQVSVSYAPVYNVQGSGPEIDALKRQMARDKAEFTANVVDTIKDAQKRSFL